MRVVRGLVIALLTDPRWKIWDAIRFAFEADVAALYGEQFAEVLNVSPRSAFIADGSSITVQKRQILLQRWSVAGPVLRFR